MEIKALIQKNIVLMGFILSLFFLLMAGFHYPGGSPKNSSSIGYSFTENYISNLLSDKAVNGMDNKARPFGVAGVVLLGAISGLAFVRFSQKVAVRKYSVVIKYLGIVLIFFSFIIIIPSLHDLMVTLSSVLTLVLGFYVMFLFMKTKLQLFKFASVILMLFFYAAAYMYFTRTGLDYLPMVQKTIHILQIIWILGIEYLTSKKDFDHIIS